MKLKLGVQSSEASGVLSSCHMQTGAPDVSVLSPKAHSLAAALFLLAASSALATLGVALWSLACMGVAKLGGPRRVLGSTIVAMVAARGGGAVPLGMDQQEFVSRGANTGGWPRPKGRF